MGIFSTLGKGFRFFLMSMGVSTYSKKNSPAPTSTAPVPSPTVAPPVKPD